MWLFRLLTMKVHTIILFFILLFYPVVGEGKSHGRNLDRLLLQLDSMMALREQFEEAKWARIAELRKEVHEVRTLEEQYWLNKRFYDEYFVFNADSAFVYADRNAAIAARLNRKEWIDEWHIKRSFLLSATGQLTEALEELTGMNGSQLPDILRVEYYGQKVYLYSHMVQYTGDTGERRDYYQALNFLYNDSVMQAVTADHPFYLWFKGWRVRENAEKSERVLKDLDKMMRTAKFDSRRDAMHAYLLANLYKDRGDKENFLKYLILSAMADIRTANKDIASLEELAKALFELGDIDHAYSYINYCLQNALLYRNRVRLVSIMTVQDDIRLAYAERNLHQERRLRMFLWGISALLVVLLGMLFYIMKQTGKLARSRKRLNQANEQLNVQLEELSEARKELAEANTQLLQLNEKLQETNGLLRESNYVKEEYIGYVFSICSTYITKLDEYRKKVNRMVKAKLFDDLKKMTDSSSMAQAELKEFYHNFDTIFLHVYPDFVNDFNQLLQPEERVVLKEGELLNTELRIYALVRLGITDSVKIAEFLHCSPQTVYNNRLKTRNKAIIPKDTFADTVKTLGKMQDK